MCSTLLRTSGHPYELAAALVLQNDPSLSPNEFEACLKISGVPLLDDANGVTTPRIDAFARKHMGRGRGVVGHPPPAPIGWPQAGSEVPR